MNTILFTEEEKRKGIVLEDAHPIEYVNARNHQFEDIQKNVQVQKFF